MKNCSLEFAYVRMSSLNSRNMSVHPNEIKSMAWNPAWGEHPIATERGSAQNQSDELMAMASDIRKIAFPGDSSPRKCGMATFTSAPPPFEPGCDCGMGLPLPARGRRMENGGWKMAWTSDTTCYSLSSIFYPRPGSGPGLKQGKAGD